ncbi:MAG TPA: hypothetical protein PKN29_02325 [Candidatus Ozemobacteraceae bacterium]|nr:hypothetical protein [Candidatus Ozemobacteraceae bacterium]
MKYLRILLCLALAFACSNLNAAPSLEKIQKKIASAEKLWDSDAQKAQSLLKEAFTEAINWTRAEYVENIREQGFFTAITCLSPELVDEVTVAADTYEKVFPKGRYLKKVYLYRAMAAWAVKDSERAQQALNDAAAIGRLSYPEQSMIMTGYLADNRHRTAEKFIEGQRINRPSARLTRDLKRFHAGNRLVEGLLNRYRDGKITSDKAVVMLEDAVNRAWFAKRAPEAALNVIAIKDSQAPYFNSIITEWCGLERVVRHGASPQIRLARLEKIVANFPEAAPEERFKALVDLIYLHQNEFRNTEEAARYRQMLSGLTGIAEKVELENLISALTPARLATEQANTDLKRILELKALLPYDNSNLPVVNQNYIEFMLAISDMILGRASRIEKLDFAGWGKLPADLLYLIATNKKDKAWEMFNVLKPSLNAQTVKLVEDFLLPMFLNTKPKDRIFLAGLAAVEQFPDLGTDLIIEALSGAKRIYKAEHGLAVLADVYRRHMAFAEAQSVWSILKKLYPDSIWLK